MPFAHILKGKGWKQQGFTTSRYTEDWLRFTSYTQEFSCCFTTSNPLHQHIYSSPTFQKTALQTSPLRSEVQSFVLGVIPLPDQVPQCVINLLNGCGVCPLSSFSLIY
ncbi:uncharacterized [Tachysurus ichikawai]